MLDYAALNALRAVLRCGSFDAAAAQLGVSGSAVSQRIKGLEDQMGAPLVIRAQPARATELGAKLARHAETVAAMERDLIGDDRAAPAVIRIATPADVLSTWFPKALGQVPGMAFDLVIDDQDHSTDWLRNGEVAAAITSRGQPVQGCDSHPLGQMRYLATASPGFIARWFPHGVTPDALRAAPMLVFNEKDRLQHRWVRAQFDINAQPPIHKVPSSHGFSLTAQEGLGWGMNPADLVAAAIADGRLSPLTDAPLMVPLYWQSTRAGAAVLGPLRDAITRVTRSALSP